MPNKIIGLLCQLTLLWLLPAPVQAQYTFTTNADNTLTITGYAGPGGAVTIPDRIDGLVVSEIGNEAFDQNWELTSVTIPASVKVIDGGSWYEYYDWAWGLLEHRYFGAFYQCYNLTNVLIQNGVLVIGDYAFTECPNLNNISLGNSLIYIGRCAFAHCYSLTKMIFPPSLTTIQYWSGYEEDPRMALYYGLFDSCSCLTGVYFMGNPAGLDYDPLEFNGDSATTVYYLPDNINWPATFCGRPTARWVPVTVTSDGSFGIQTNQFGFNISWAPGQTVVVEGSTNLLNWVPVATNLLSTSTSYFRDLQWTNNPSRYYRLRSP